MSDLSVLIVDDNEVDRYLLRRQLYETGLNLEVFEEVDGGAALTFLQNFDQNSADCPDTCPPTIIFLDINMPVLTGLEFLEKFAILHRREVFRSCIVMMFTSSEQIEDMHSIERFEFVKDYLVKGSISAADLRHRVERAISID